jgi:hypothetical protein
VYRREALLFCGLSSSPVTSPIAIFRVSGGGCEIQLVVGLLLLISGCF